AHTPSAHPYKNSVAHSKSSNPAWMDRHAPHRAAAVADMQDQEATECTVLACHPHTHSAQGSAEYRRTGYRAARDLARSVLCASPFSPRVSREFCVFRVSSHPQLSCRDTIQIGKMCHAR